MNKLVRAAALSTAILAVTAAPAMACFQKTYEPAASLAFCGDPRALITLDNTASNVDATFRVVFKSGNPNVAPARRVVTIDIDGGEMRTIKRWVKGGSDVIVRDGFRTLLARETVDVTGPCPKAS